LSQSITKFKNKWGYTAVVAGLLLLLLSFGASAQEDTLEEGALELPEMLSGELAGIDHLAASLSQEDSRMEALLTLIMVDHMLQDPVVPGQLHARWQAERVWLDQLAERFPDVAIRSSVMDPTSWFMLLELDLHQIKPSILVSPQGPATAVLIRQLFDREDERLAAVLLPEVLVRMESESGRIWQEMLIRAAGDDEWLKLVVRVDSELVKPWIAVELTATGRQDSGDPISQAMESFQALATSAALAGAPDTLRLQEMRYLLLRTMPEMNELLAREAVQLLRLATAVDGLNENKHLAFAEAMLWVVTEMLLAGNSITETDPAQESTTDAAEELGLESDSAPGDEAVEPEPVVVPVSELPRVLVELIPQISSAFARQFSNTDPRINTVLATVYDVVQNLQDGPPNAGRKPYLYRELADAVAQLVLMIPDMDFYFNQPVRKLITDEIDACSSIVAATSPDGETLLSRKQFDLCLSALADLSETLVRKAELAGDPDGPFGANQLRRELQMTPGQRINYALGYLHERHDTSCQFPEKALPNPLEWAALATSLAWFAEQSPIYFQTPANEALVLRMRQQGMELLRVMEQQVICFSRTDQGINDPVRRSLFDYSQALEAFAAGVSEAELIFRQERLAPGADIVLSQDATQQTAYRTDGLMIGPCDTERICEMTGELESTRALIGLFPNHYLVADQAGLGNVEICYDNMKWVQRRSELIRPDDPNVANYYGHLSFDLLGRYVENDVVSDVFGSNFISPDEYQYLFAAASEEVLKDSCPSEWVGSKIVTRLGGERSFRIIPDRLTYLASARSQPSQIINSNWGRGAEWRDWFVTGLGVTPYEYEKDEKIIARINQHLQGLYKAEQTMLYNALLRRPSGNRVDPGISLYTQMTALDTAKRLVRFNMSLFYPEMLLDSDEIRGSLEGTGSLVDGAMLKRFGNSNVPVETINDIAESRLQGFNAQWARQSISVRRSGSVALSLAHAITRLNALYEAFFSLPPGLVEKDEPTAAPSGAKRVFAVVGYSMIP
jgi:hypothetical protein